MTFFDVHTTLHTTLFLKAFMFIVDICGLCWLKREDYFCHVFNHKYDLITK